MTDLNLGWLRAYIARKLDYSSTEPDQAYGGTSEAPWLSIDDAINMAYTELINEAKLEVDQANFLARYLFTWSANTTTHVLPRDVAYSMSQFLLDVTNNENGDEVPVYKSFRSGGLYWQDNRTLHWSDTSGPSEDKSFVWTYLADAEELVEVDQVPVLIPWRYRYLLAWKAIVLLRSEVDEDNMPRSWAGRVEKLTTDFILDLSQGRLRFTVPPRRGGAFDDSSSSGV